DDGQVRLVVFRQRHGAQDRCLLGNAALGHVQDVLECIHADHASWIAWLREWYDARDRSSSIAAFAANPRLPRRDQISVPTRPRRLATSVASARELTLSLR